jgi:hypothetical protein
MAGMEARVTVITEGRLDLLQSELDVPNGLVTDVQVENPCVAFGPNLKLPGVCGLVVEHGNNAVFFEKS